MRREAGADIRRCVGKRSGTAGEAGGRDTSVYVSAEAEVEDVP